MVGMNNKKIYRSMELKNKCRNQKKVYSGSIASFYTSKAKTPIKLLSKWWLVHDDSHKNEL